MSKLEKRGVSRMWDNVYLNIKTQKLPDPFSRPWTPTTDSLFPSCKSAPLRGQLLASEAAPLPPTESWIRTWIITNFSARNSVLLCECEELSPCVLFKSLSSNNSKQQDYFCQILPDVFNEDGMFKNEQQEQSFCLF